MLNQGISASDNIDTSKSKEPSASKHLEMLNKIQQTYFKMHCKAFTNISGVY